MATPTSVTVDTDGSSGDYASLNAAITGEAGDLVTADEQLTINCQATDSDADTTEATISGFTTDSTRYVRITPASGDKHAGEWDTSKYRLVVSSGEAIIPSQDHSYIEDLQIGTTGSGGYVYAIFLDSSNGPIYFKRCIIYSDCSGSYNRNRFNNGTVNFYNCTFQGFSWAHDTREDAAITTVGGTVNAYNCSVHKNGTGVYVLAGTITAKNCISTDNKGSDYYGCSLTTCISSDTSGSDGYRSKTSSDLMVDPDNGDFSLKTGSFAIDAGDDLSASMDSEDIIGTERPQGDYWDIGAFEYEVPLIFLPIYKKRLNTLLRL